MKTLKISDDAHRKLTSLIGELTAQTSRTQTYQDLIIYATQQLALKFLKENYELREIPRDKYKRLDAAVKEIKTPYRNALDFICSQIDEVLKNRIDVR